MKTRAYIHKRDKKWVVITPLPDGRKKWQTVGRKKDAERLRDEINRRTQLGVAYVDETPTTFKEFADNYLESYQLRVRESAYDIASRARRHLGPLDRLTLDQVRAGDVEAVVNPLARKSPRMAQLALAQAKAILRSASERGHTIDAAIFKIKRPKYKSRTARALTWDQITEISDALPEFLRRIVPVAALTGLRQGELLALRDSDVDLKAATVTVQEAKTEAGVRRVELPDLAVRLLAEQLLARPPGVELVFHAPKGGPLNRNVLMHRYFKPAVESVELQDITFHELRHSFVSLMASAGVHVSVIAEMVGHNDGGALVLKTYRHLFPGETRRAADALNDLVTATEENVGVAQG